MIFHFKNISEVRNPFPYFKEGVSELLCWTEVFSFKYARREASITWGIRISAGSAPAIPHPSPQWSPPRVAAAERAKEIPF
jgi:hypothetical protein